MVNERASLKRAIRTPAKLLIFAVTPRLGTRSVTALLAAAERIGVGARVSAVVLREATRRLETTDAGRPIGAALSQALLDRPRLPTEQRARLLRTLSRAERDVGQFHEAIANLTEALSLLPRKRQWRRELLQLAAAAGDRHLFYAHLTTEIQAEATPAELGNLVGELANSCRKASDWRGAADAYHHAHALVPKNKAWNSQYLKMRQLAPDWGFYSHDPQRAFNLDDYPEAASRGIVAPFRQPVFGWLPASAEDTLVIFKLNGNVIAETRAATPVTLPDGNDYLQFSRNIKEIWSYAGTGDFLSIEANGHALQIINRGDQYAFRRKESRADELLAMLEDGSVFNKYGLVKPSLQADHSWQTGMFDLYTKLRHDLQSGLGLSIFPFYGTMLGAVREQNFIGNNNDFDTVYISEHSEPEKVRQEFKELCTFLLSQGYDLHVKSTHTWVKLPGTPHKLDIFFAWFNTDGYFDVSYNYHGTPVQKSAAFFEFRSEKIGEFEIPVPQNAEEILNQLYGTSWRVPDPGFAHNSATSKSDRRYRLGTRDVTELHWNQFYRDHEPDRASRFAEFVVDRFPSAGTVVEFGCGSGRDSIFFAAQGWTTFSCDRSPEAIARTNHILQASGGLPAQFQVVDAASADDIRRFLTTHDSRLDEADPLVVYVRFFFHAIDERAQNTLLDTLTSTLTRDFYLCAEFRTVEDRYLVKYHGAHYRRYINHHDLASQLRDRWGFDIEHLEAGQGLSPYDGEDPYLSRIIARRPTSEDTTPGK